MRVLVTGGSGLVGTAVTAALEAAGHDVLAVSRRGRGRCHAWPLDEAAPAVVLAFQPSVVVHAAAAVRFAQTPEAAFTNNVASAYTLAEAIGTDVRMIHVSSQFARPSGDAHRPRFRNNYERSKHAAECVVAELFPDALILRPPLVLGSRSGPVALPTYNGLYDLLSGFLSGHFPALVGRPDAPAPLVSCEDVASIVVEHLASSRTGVVGLGCCGGLDVGELVAISFDVVNRVRRDAGVPEVEPPKIVEPARWERLFKPLLMEELSPRQQRLLELGEVVAPYLSLDTSPPTDEWFPDPGECIEYSVESWCEAHPRRALAQPRAWVPSR